MRVGISLGVFCTATCRANPTFLHGGAPNDQIGQLLSGFIELRKEVLKQQEEANSYLARRLRAGDNLHAFKRVGN